MASFQKQVTSSALDSFGGPVIPLFGGQDAGYTEPFWHVERIEYRFGAEPSSFTIACPTTGWGGIAPLLAGLPPATGPLANAKIWKPTSAQVFGVAGLTKIMHGSVVVIDENLDDDGATIEILDKRYEMEGCVIVGSWWIEDVGGLANYRNATPAWFNKDGLPNRTKAGGSRFTYAFCESNYGLADGQVVPDPAENNAGVATHWTPDSIAVYLQETTDPQLRSTQLVGSFKEYCFLPENLIFPKGVANQLISVVGNARAQTMDFGKAYEFICDSTPLNHALHHVFQMAGPFALNLAYNNDGTSTIECVKTRNADISGVTLQFARGKDVSAFSDFGKVIGGGIKRDARQLYAQAVVAGREQFVESRIASTNSDDIATQTAAGIELITAWDPSQKKQIIADYNKAWDDGQQLTLPQLLQEYDLAFAAYRLNPNKDFSLGTSESRMPWCRTTNRSILPHLLTRYTAEVNINGQSTPIQLKTGFFPIPLEYCETVTDSPAGDGTPQAPPQSDNGLGAAAPGNSPPDPNPDANTVDDAVSNMIPDVGENLASGDGTGGGSGNV